MEISATKSHTRSNRLRSTLFIAALLAACHGTAAAQSPMLTEAEMRDLRHEARSMHVTIRPVPAAEPTDAEMRDLRLASRPTGLASDRVPAGVISEKEMRDLRRLARREQVARQNAAFETVR